MKINISGDNLFSATFTAENRAENDILLKITAEMNSVHSQPKVEVKKKVEEKVAVTGKKKRTRTVTCPYCKRKCGGGKRGLSIHITRTPACAEMRAQASNLLHECSYCHKKFVSASGLKEHFDVCSVRTKKLKKLPVVKTNFLELEESKTSQVIV
jgi:hypothetical protein